MDSIDLGKFRNQLLKENFETPLKEMAKIQGDLKTAIEKVISSNPELDGLPLKKIIRADQSVLDALQGDDLYDNQLNKFIALSKGTRTLQPRGRKASNISPEPPQSKDNNSEFSIANLSKSNSPINNISGDDEEISIDDLSPTDADIDNSITQNIPTDINSANNYKNIILKKVGKIEKLNNPNDLAALKQFIAKPEVKKALGNDMIKSLVSDIIQ